MENRFENFTILISKISRSIRRIKTEEMAGFDLKSPHVSCLYYIYKNNALTAKELCDICDEDKSAISRSLEYLEKEGYLYCESKTAKRYKSVITLTEKGENVGREVVKKVDEILAISSVGVSEEERVILYKVLTSINQNLENIINKGEN